MAEGSQAQPARCGYGGGSDGEKRGGVGERQDRLLVLGPDGMAGTTGAGRSGDVVNGADTAKLMFYSSTRRIAVASILAAS